MTAHVWTRRQLLVRGTLALGGLMISGCDRLNHAPSFKKLLSSAERLTLRSQRLILPRQKLAPEFSEADLSPVFRSNGTSRPTTEVYQQILVDNFASWNLQVNGLVAHPLSLPLAALRAMPARTQITRHDCVEGWSAIGKWTGVPLAAVLNLAQLKPEARFIVLHCADRLWSGSDTYYESIDLIDAFHPQTLLAYELNGTALPVANGAPLRLRVERQLGYKQAKYIMRVEAVSELQGVHGGKGGFWEDLGGYEWYAGI